MVDKNCQWQDCNDSLLNSSTGLTSKCLLPVELAPEGTGG